MTKDLTTIHPSIKTEVALLDRSVEMAEMAFAAINTGAAEARNCNVIVAVEIAWRPKSFVTFGG